MLANASHKQNLIMISEHTSKRKCSIKQFSLMDQRPDHMWRSDSHQQKLETLTGFGCLHKHYLFHNIKLYNARLSTYKVTEFVIPLKLVPRNFTQFEGNCSCFPAFRIKSTTMLKRHLPSVTSIDGLVTQDPCSIGNGSKQVLNAEVISQASA